jgi:CBS domain-containing protein
MKASDLMTKSVFTCHPADTLEQAARVLWEEDIGCLVVVDDEERPVAMLTDRDICMAAYTQGVALRDARVGGAMSRHLVSASPETSSANLEALMASAQIRRIPVIGRDGKLAGIVTLGDIARYALASPLHFTTVPAVATTLAAVIEPRRSSAAA